MALIEPGKKAPLFSLPDQAGKAHSLADYAGQPVVIYFYPKDDTPGCNKQSCAFQDHLPKFKNSKAKFAAKYVKVDGHAEEVLTAVQAL